MLVSTPERAPKMISLVCWLVDVSVVTFPLMGSWVYCVVPDMRVEGESGHK